MKILAAPALLVCLLASGCGKASSGKEPVHIKLTAKKYRFEPSEVRVKRGDEVLLEVSSSDVQHGFHVPDLGIDEPIQKGKPAEIRFSAKDRGEFKIECDIICGPGHDDMAGKIVVE